MHIQSPVGLLPLQGPRQGLPSVFLPPPRLWQGLPSVFLPPQGSGRDRPSVFLLSKALPTSLRASAGSVKAGEAKGQAGASSSGAGALGLLGPAELDLRRADSFRGLVAPQLRGEGNWRNVALYATHTARIFFAVDAMLSAVPFWFKGDEWMRWQIDMGDTLAGVREGAVCDVAACLIDVQSLLGQAGLMAPSWKAFEPLWRRALNRCSNMADALLLTAVLQDHMARKPGVLPRRAFTKIAQQARSQLYFPFPGETVVLLRTGMLLHIKRYMQSLQLIPPDKEPTPPPPPVRQVGPPKEEDDDDEDVEDFARDSAEPMEEDEPPREAPATSLVASPIPEALREAVRAQWEQLRASVEKLRAVERYRVVSIAYRRSLLEGSAAEGSTGEGPADMLRAAPEYWPACWLLLRPMRAPDEHTASRNRHDIAVPIRIDLTLPDAIIKADNFDRAMKCTWQENDHFRMFFANKRANSKTGGTYYKGIVSRVLKQQPGEDAPAQVKEAYDPWEAIEVVWDVAKLDHNDCEFVSPWELERDPDIEEKEIAEKRKAGEAAARARRAARGDARLKTEDAGDVPPAAKEKTPEQQARGSDLVSRAGNNERAQPARDAHSDAPAVLPTIPKETPSPRKKSPSDVRQDASAPAREHDTSAGRGNTATKGGAAAAALSKADSEAPSVPYIAREITEEVLAPLRGLSRTGMENLLANWYRGVKGKFKVPIFAHRDLDLYRVFWAVVERGGNEHVTFNKQWKDICRCLDIDLTGQTSASYNMRQNYEKCLLEFEAYVTSGQYAAELAVGQAPASDFVERYIPSKQTLEVVRDVNAQIGTAGIRAPGDTPAAPLQLRAGRGRTVGPRMTALGPSMVGKQVKRFWQGEGGWWDATIAQYNSKTQKHRVIYSPGTDMESFEWVLFAELSDKEIKESPSFKLDDLEAAAGITGGTSVGSGPGAPQPVRQLLLPSIAPPAAKPQPTPLPAAAATPANQVEIAKSILCDLLARGHSPAALHALLDEAAGSAEMPQSTPVPVAGPGERSARSTEGPPACPEGQKRAPSSSAGPPSRISLRVRLPGKDAGAPNLPSQDAGLLAQAPHATESQTPHGTSTSLSPEAASRRTTSAGHRERASPTPGVEPDTEGEDSAKGARVGGLGSGVRGAHGGAEADGGVRSATGSHAMKRSGASDGEQAGFAAPRGPVSAQPAGSPQASVRGGAEQQPPACASVRSDGGEMGAEGDAGARPEALLGASPMEVDLDGAPLEGAGSGVLGRPGTEMGAHGDPGSPAQPSRDTGVGFPTGPPCAPGLPDQSGPAPQRGPAEGPSPGAAGPAELQEPTANGTMHCEGSPCLSDEGGHAGRGSERSVKASVTDMPVDSLVSGREDSAGRAADHCENEAGGSPDLGPAAAQQSAPTLHAGPAVRHGSSATAGEGAGVAHNGLAVSDVSQAGTCGASEQGSGEASASMPPDPDGALPAKLTPLKIKLSLRSNPGLVTQTLPR
eukprot:jgi/Botrbrau1/8721/Bobra.0311s0031.1